MRAWWLVLVLGCSETLVETDAAVGDNGEKACTVVSDCIPCFAEGNEKKVGEYCTSGGGQCDDNGLGNAIFCALDFRTDAPPMCIKPCAMDADCGSGASCLAEASNPTQKACVPNACTGSGDAGTTDTGTADAGAAD